MSNQLFPTSIKPVVKWIGGKSQLINELNECINALTREIAEEKFNYHETFFGGGALFFDLYLNNKIRKAYLNDINTELIILYNSFLHDQTLNNLINDLIIKEEEFNSSKKREKLFKSWRLKFNKLILKKNLTVKEKLEISSLLIALNKTCFNGVYRKNKKGEFNVPFGSKKTEVVKFFNKENLRKVSKSFEIAEFTNKSFEKAINFTKIKKNHLVFLDPPYIPVSKTAQFKSYYDDGFNNEEHELLASKLDKIDSKGAFFILTNSNTELTKKIYLKNSKFNKYEVNVARMINRVGKDETGSGTKELIITNFKVPNLGN